MLFPNKALDLCPYINIGLVTPGFSNFVLRGEQIKTLFDGVKILPALGKGSILHTEQNIARIANAVQVTI